EALPPLAGPHARAADASLADPPRRGDGSDRALRDPAAARSARRRIRDRARRLDGRGRQRRATDRRTAEQGAGDPAPDARSRRHRGAVSRRRAADRRPHPGRPVLARPAGYLRSRRARAAELMHFIVGTAGHIDHGKTALVKALTGQDTDRLKEEKERGISIDLGFAELALAGGARAGVVDVPGHERFIKNM